MSEAGATNSSLSSLPSSEMLLQRMRQRANLLDQPAADDDEEEEDTQQEGQEEPLVRIVLRTFFFSNIISF